MTTNPFLNRSARQAKQPKSYWRSQKQEKELGLRLGAKRISGSGNGKKKGDLFISGVVRIEAKTTLKKSFSVTKEMLEKITNACVASGEVPVIVVEFLGEDGKPEGEVCVVPMKQLELLIHAAQDTQKTG